MQSYKLNTENQTKLDLLVFSYPKEKAKGIVQVIHGALEYKERYVGLAQFLNEQGYVVVLSDNRGHGESTSAQDPFGVMRDVDLLLADQKRVLDFIKAKYPGLPVTIFGHSYGAILGRLFLQKHDHEIAKLIITGTPYYVGIVPLGIKITQLAQLYKKEDEYSWMVQKICGASITGYDWLSYNQENIEKVKNDPKMMKQYPVISMETMLRAMYRLKDYRSYQCQNPMLPIYNLVGCDDQQITGGQKGIADSLATLQKVGYQNIRSEEMSGMKHEILFEDRKEDVYAKILAFLEQ
ncbi:alpha/beta hydrolase [Ligilactobacillus ceti]|uniref:alpha/beta hydrolase n=1 Tax=Ligilactobacillus ceti TaxID=395085 RepID=UPI0003FFC2E6|nr:alpha/beta hydrolase [Ligilactobacillus ceti]